VVAAGLAVAFRAFRASRASGASGASAEVAGEVPAQARELEAARG